MCAATFIIAPTRCSTGPFTAVKGRYPPPLTAAHMERLSVECLERESRAGAHVTFDDDRTGDPRAQADDAAVLGHHRAAARIGTTAALSAAK